MKDPFGPKSEKTAPLDVGNNEFRTRTLSAKTKLKVPIPREVTMIVDATTVVRRAVVRLFN